MKIKTTLIYYASYITLANVQKLDITVCWQGCRKTSMFAYLTLVLQYYIANVKRDFSILIKFTMWIHLFFDIRILH